MTDKLSTGRDIFLVTMTTHDGFALNRAFETRQEAKQYVEEQHFHRVDVGGGEFLFGSLWTIKTIRLGRYEDGS